MVKHLVFLDESGVNTNLTRLYGRALSSQRAVDHAPLNTPQTTTVLSSIRLRACLKSSNEDGNECKRENLSRNIKFAFTIFPKSAEFVEPAEKALYHPAAWQNDKLV
jgi:hypothetical protein